VFVSLPPPLLISDEAICERNTNTLTTVEEVRHTLVAAHERVKERKKGRAGGRRKHSKK
jgi:hypothetical protein